MIEKFTKNLLEKFIYQLNDETNKKKINEKILNPLFIEFYQRLSPYISILFIMYGFSLILTIVIFDYINLILKSIHFNIS